MYKILHKLADWWYMREFVSVNGWWWKKVYMPLSDKAHK